MSENEPRLKPGDIVRFVDDRSIGRGLWLIIGSENIALDALCVLMRMGDAVMTRGRQYQLLRVYL